MSMPSHIPNQTVSYSLPQIFAGYIHRILVSLLLPKVLDEVCVALACLSKAIHFRSSSLFLRVATIVLLFHPIKVDRMIRLVNEIIVHLIVISVVKEQLREQRSECKSDDSKLV